MAVLGLGDSILLSRDTKVGRDSQGRFYAAPTYTPGTIAMYDARGRLQRVFGRSGRGPGEFRGDFSQLLVGPGDTLHVLEQAEHTVLAPGLAHFVRRTQLVIPAWRAAVLPDRRLLLQLPLIGAGGAHQLLHLMDHSGELMRSFGGDGSATPPRDVWAGSRVISTAPDGEIWAGHSSRYRLERWSTDGVLQQTIDRDADWFLPWSGYDAGEPFRKPPRPVLAMVGEDPQGLVWTVVAVADRNWKPLIYQGEVAVRDTDQNTLWDSIIEVLDPKSGRVLARTRIDQSLGGFLGDPRLIYTHRTSIGGEEVIDVWQMRFTRPERSK